MGSGSGLVGAAFSAFSCLRSIPQSHRKVVISFDFPLVLVVPKKTVNSEV